MQDLLIDDHTWAIRYLIVNTSNWWGNTRCSLRPPVDRVGELGGQEGLYLFRSRATPSRRLPPTILPRNATREQGTGHAKHYGRPRYWTCKEIREEQLAASSIKNN